MIKLCIDDKLLVRQTAEVPEVPWRWNIKDFVEGHTIAFETAIVEDYEEVTLDLTTYETYIGKTLMLEILDNTGELIEEGFFLISGVYCRLPEVKVIAGHLGENIKKVAPNSSDWQDGHPRRKDVTLYTDAALITELKTYEWAQSYVTDYIPDARYHIQKVNQKEETE